MTLPVFTPSTPPTIFSLPTEVIEQTLITTALLGFPSSIASFSVTCKHFYSLVNKSGDFHLWREIFLTTFDDPRPLLTVLKTVTPLGPSKTLGPHDGPIPFPWAEEFKQRLSAVQYLRGWYNATQHNPRRRQRSDCNKLSNLAPETYPELSLVLQSLDSVLSTTRPFPCTPRAIDFTLSHPPAFPPIVLLRSSALPFPPSFESLNAIWINRLLGRGFPDTLTRCLLENSALLSGNVDSSSEHEALRHVSQIGWPMTEEGQLFYKLVFLIGFIPMPTSDRSTQDTNIRSDMSLNKCEVRRYSPSTSSFAYPNPKLTQEQQIASARRRARHEVYNLRYPSRDRTWGPFLPVSRTTSASKPSDKSAGTSHSHSVVVCASGLHIPPPTPSMPSGSGVTIEQINTSLDPTDADYIPDPEEDPEETEGSIDEDEMHMLIADQILIEDDNVIESVSAVSAPHLVVPDFNFLASARLLIECNLRDMLRESPEASPVVEGTSLMAVVDALGCLEFLRMGSAPDFWGGSWGIDPEDELAKVDTEQDVKGKMKEKQEGWDWAGAGGSWRRTVCWMDYRDLLLHNLGSVGSDDDEIEETIRIFPLTLRVTGYSKAPVSTELSPSLNPLVWILPVIHVEGESIGSDMDEDEVRKIKGTVRMTQSGVVRWSMTTSYADSDEPEWATEGIQVGAIGSALGIIGMWTGADHARASPLGPFWALKVAS